MYEVFLNDRKINIAAQGKITLNKSSQVIDNLMTTEEVEMWFLEFAKNKLNQVFLLHPNSKYFFEELFQKAFKVIYAAGGVVKRNNELLFIYRNNTWDLPKGKIDKGESPKLAALREVEEECGITGHKIINPLPSTFHMYQSPYKESKGEWIFKETYWFEMEYEGLQDGNPQLEENITQIKWFKKDDLNEVLANTFSNLIPLINIYRD